MRRRYLHTHTTWYCSLYTLELIYIFSCIQYTTVAFIHPRVNPWCSVFDHIECEKAPKLLSVIHAKKCVLLKQTPFSADALVKDIEALGLICEAAESETALIDYVAEHEDLDHVVLAYQFLPKLNKLNSALIMDIKAFTKANIYLCANQPMTVIEDYVATLDLRAGLNLPYRMARLKAMFAGESMNAHPIKKSEVLTDKATNKHLQPEKVLSALLVDDNPINLKLLDTFVKATGMKTAISESAKEALTLAKQQQFDLVLTDLHMPEMDGIDLCHELRKIDAYKQTPIIVVTADIAQEKLQYLQDQGFDDVQTKPIDSAKIQNLIERFFENMLITKASKKQCKSQVPTHEKSIEAQYIDLTLGVRLAAGDEAFAREILATFMQNLVNELARIDHAYQQQNGQLMKELVHKLHGGACYCGVPALKAQTAILEKALNDASYQISKEVTEQYQRFKDVSTTTITSYKRL